MAQSVRRKPKKRRLSFGKRLLIFLLALVVIALALVKYTEMRMKPILTSMATASAQRIAARAVSEAIYDEITTESITYNDLINLEKDNSGKISALRTNVIEINRLKSRLAVVILDKLASIEETTIRIPLGNIINGELLSGRGVKIELRLIPVGSVTTDISNVFTSAGINQTRHQIMMEVRAMVSVILPMSSISADITTSVCIAETVIVGEVPSAFTEVNDDGGLSGTVNDYGYGNGPSPGA